MIYHFSLRDKMTSILGFLQEEIAGEINPQAQFNLKDVPVVVVPPPRAGPVIPSGPVPEVRIVERSKIAVADTELFRLDGQTIELDRLRPIYAGKTTPTYKVSELNEFLKVLGIPISSMNKSQKVDRLREEIRKRDPNVIFE